jgi:signal peptidase I
MKNSLKGNRGFIAFLLCFGFFRLAIADWNPVPSGSMRPTLLVGDVVLVNRLAYDFKLPLSDSPLLQLGEPQRGDVNTFSSPFWVTTGTTAPIPASSAWCRAIC